MTTYSSSLPLSNGYDPHVRDYIALLKPRVMSLVVFTAFVGMVISPTSLHPVLAFGSLLCIAVGAGASAALNMWWDRDIDAIMKRTKNRPIPAGSIAPKSVLAFGLGLSIASVGLLGLIANAMAAALLAFTIFFYAVVYTIWLKRSTAQNIVIGGAAGALPPVVGWAATTGTISLEGIVLFMIIFLWTPPHFWALALFRNEDYTRANIPMMPVTHGDRKTRSQILLYTLLLVPTTLAPVFLGFGHMPYAVTALVVNGMFLRQAWHVYNTTSEYSKKTGYKSEKTLFFTSLIYLFALFGALLFEYVLSRYVDVSLPFLVL